MRVGCPFKRMRSAIAGEFVEISTTTISRSRALETKAVELPWMATHTGYSPPGTPLPGRRSSSAKTLRPAMSTRLMESFSLIRHHQSLAVCGQCQAHCTRGDVPQSQRRGMTKFYWSAAFGPAASIPVVEMNVVIRPPTDVKLLPGRIKREPIESARHLKDLCFERLPAGNIKDKNIFVGLVGIGVSKIRARGNILAVVAAGKNEQRVSVGTDCRGYRLPDGKARIERQSRIQRLERRPGSGRWCDVHARRNEGPSLQDGVIRPGGNHSSNADKTRDCQRKCGHNHLRPAGSAIPQHVLPPVYSAVLGILVEWTLNNGSFQSVWLRSIKLGGLCFRSFFRK